MNSMLLQDINGNKFKAEVLFTLFDYKFGKNYIIYLIDNDLLASSYEEIEDKYIIKNDLSSKEYEMIDKTIERNFGDLYA